MSALPPKSAPQPAARTPWSTKAWTSLKTSFPLLVIAGAFLWSVVVITTYRRQQSPPGTTVELRLGHWQLETGVREAFDKLAAEYTKLHPGVHIIQDAVPEGAYGQWMVTQLMGGTAPDILETGNGVPYNVLLGFYSRYFIPLTAYVKQPNPYNQGTALSNTVWRSTFKDAMRSGYIEELQEYMTVPLSQFGVRIFYNKTLLKKLTGLNEAPRNFQAFIAACERIKSCQDEKGRPYTPIAASGYHMFMWDGFLSDPLTFGAVRRLDFNRDGAVGNDELFIGFKTDRVNADFPPFKAKFRMTRELTQQCQPGFTGLGRDEAVFLFAQQRAVFISTGTWDAGSLLEQAKGSFEVGIMAFPFPAKDDPMFGSVAEGPAYERMQFQGFPFAITRTSKHPEVALDFLMFLSSQRNNEELNRIIGWIPSISGASLPPFLKAFEPVLEGVFGAMPITLGGETIIKWSQVYSLFQVGQIGYEALMAEFVPFYLNKGVVEYEEMQRSRRRGVAGDEQFMAGMRSQALLAPDAESLEEWNRYRRLTSDRLLTRDLGPVLMEKQLNAGRMPNATAPYDFSPEVIARVQARLKEKERR